MKEIGKWLFLASIVGAGMFWFIAKFLVPPDLSKVSGSSSSSSIAVAPEPAEPATPVAMEADDEESNAVAVDEPEEDEPASVVAEEEPTSIGGTEIVESSPESNVAEEDLIPAIAQAEDVVIEVPNKIEQGGVLKIYNNHDGSTYPDTIRYSPIDIQDTNGLYLAGNDDRRKFQEVSGFIVVPESGEYNFNVDYPDHWGNINTGTLRLEVSQTPFPAVTGGRIKLEEGLHPISLFAYIRRTTGKDIYVSWGKVGEPLETVEIYREVEEEVAAETNPAPAPTQQQPPAVQTELAENQTEQPSGEEEAQ